MTNFGLTEDGRLVLGLICEDGRVELGGAICGDGRIISIFMCFSAETGSGVEAEALVLVYVRIQLKLLQEKGINLELSQRRRGGSAGVIIMLKLIQAKKINMVLSTGNFKT